MTEDTRTLGEIKSQIEANEQESSPKKESRSSKTKTYSQIDLPMIIDENSRVESL